MSCAKFFAGTTWIESSKRRNWPKLWTKGMIHCFVEVVYVVIIIFLLLFFANVTLPLLFAALTLWCFWDM